MTTFPGEGTVLSHTALRNGSADAPMLPRQRPFQQEGNSNREACRELPGAFILPAPGRLRSSMGDRTRQAELQTATGSSSDGRLWIQPAAAS
jgi:hypothetical protein